MAAAPTPQGELLQEDELPLEWAFAPFKGAAGRAAASDGSWADRAARQRRHPATRAMLTWEAADGATWPRPSMGVHVSTGAHMPVCAPGPAVAADSASHRQPAPWLAMPTTIASWRLQRDV